MKGAGVSEVVAGAVAASWRQQTLVAGVLGWGEKAAWLVSCLQKVE